MTLSQFQVIVDWEDINTKSIIKELLDMVTIAVFRNDFSPVLNECRLGRYKYQNIKFGNNYLIWKNLTNSQTFYILF